MWARLRSLLPSGPPGPLFHTTILCCQTGGLAFGVRAYVAEGEQEAARRAELAKLPHEQLELLQAAFYEGLSHSEIATRFGLPLGTVKSRIRLAFGRLRGQLEPGGTDA